MRPARVMAAAAVVTLLAACGDGAAAPTTPPPSSPVVTPAPTSSPPPSPVVTTPATPADLADHLATPADLGPGWSLWEGFVEWPGGVPGTIPADQGDVVPDLPLCAQAGEALRLADELTWQAFTQLHRDTTDPFANMVVVQQFLLAEDPGAAAATFATLHDGLTSCLTANLPEGEWEIGFREEAAVPAVGDDRYAERTSGVDPGGARRDTRWVLVREDAILMAIRLDDVLLTADAEPALTSADVDDVVVTLAALLP